ncbi:MAG TPA: DUF6166 domain-containing protein [Candidatus Paceibacterota bacterium]|nr:DUF6166 domain-containing protein [Candidatus Paceibacterota bacterium]
MNLLYFSDKKKMGHNTVMVREEQQNKEYLDYEVKHIVRHSPDGFQWGYGGSGPSDLALSILTDYCQRMNIENIADKYYQQFKIDFISTAKDKINITSNQIKEWLCSIT